MLVYGYVGYVGVVFVVIEVINCGLVVLWVVLYGQVWWLYGRFMIELIVVWFDIDFVLKMLFDIFLVIFIVVDGVEVVCVWFCQLKIFLELLLELWIEEWIVGYDGFIDILVCVYWLLVVCDNLFVVVYYYGGGWLFGGLDIYDFVVCVYVVGVQVIVVFVDYWFVLEYFYLVGIDDSWVVLCWVGENVVELGGDLSWIVVVGDFVGGNILVVMVQLVWDVGGLLLVFQLLWYLMIMVDLLLLFFIENVDVLILDCDVIDVFLVWYVLGLDISDYMMLFMILVLGNVDLFGLFFVFIGIVEYDLLCDDGVCYVELFMVVGVFVELSNEFIMVYGYVNFVLVVFVVVEVIGCGLVVLKRVLYV